MKISVIIPIYNAYDCLEKSVRSVQAQDYDDLEIILIDDGSTDGSDRLAEELADSDDRHRTTVFHKENGGSSSARNLGIQKATGDYLGFVDSDDYIEPDMFSELAKAISEHDLMIVQTGRDEISPDGTKRADVVEVPNTFVEIPSKDFLRELLLHKGDCSFCTKLTKRELFDVSRFPEGELNEDFWLLIQMLTSDLSPKVGILPSVGYHVYYRETSNTRTLDRGAFPRVYTDIVVNAQRVEKLIQDKLPDMLEYSRRFSLVQRLDYMMHIPVGMMRSDNQFYFEVKKYLKDNRDEIKTNPLLNDDQRGKLKLLSIAPKFVRWVHLQKMKILRR